MAYVTAPDGTPGEIPDEQLATAVAQGFKPRNPAPEELARKEAATHPVIAGAEAAGRGLIPGVGAEIIANIGSEVTGQSRDEAMQGQLLRKEENPLAAAIGTGVGFTVGAGKLAAPLRTGGLIRGVLAGSAEGGLMGLSEAINESVLEDVPLTAEHLAASTMGGALGGGAVDLGFGLVGKGASALMRKAGGTAVREKLKQLGDEAITTQLGTKATLKKYGTADNISDIIDYGRQEGILTKASTFDTVAASAKEAKAKLSPVYDVVLDGLEGVSPAAAQAPQIVDDVAKALKPYERGLLAPQAAAVLAEIKTVASQPNVTWRELHAMQSDIFMSLPASGEVNSLGRKAVLQEAQAALSSSIQKNVDSGLEALAKAGVVSPEMQALGIGSGSTLKDLSRKYYYASRLEDMATERAAAAATGGLSMKDLIATGAVMSGHPAGIVTGLATAVAGKAVRERGGFVLGGALHALAESDLLESVAKSFQKNVAQRLATAPELLGPFRAVIEQASAQGATDLLQTHVELAKSAQGADYLARMGMSPENEPEVSGAGVRLANLEAIKQASREQAARMEGAVDGLFGSARGRKATVGSGMSVKEFNAVTENIRKRLADPEGAFLGVPPEVHGTAPSLVGVTGGVVLKAAQFLDSKAPKNPYAAVPESVRPEWQPSAAEIERFNRYREAVESPAKALKNMAQGYLSAEQVEALKAVYPAIYSDLQQKLSERIAESKKPLSYQQKMAVSQILGPTAIGMSSQQAQVLQQMHAQGAGKPEQGSAKKDGRQEVDAAKNQSTQAQRLESR